jgi:hypothetical protein
MIARPLSKPRTRLVLVAAVLLVIIVATVSLALALSTSISTPPINISRNEYEQALAKWKAQKIEEYEITTDTMALAGGARTLHVSDHGNKIEQLYPKLLSASASTPEDFEYLKKDTVEGMFAQVNHMLSESNAFNAVASYFTRDFYMAYQVTFDMDLGYPQAVSGWPITKTDYYISDAGWATRVTNLKIIRQGK